jgi:hypothetical protein
MYSITVKSLEYIRVGPVPALAWCQVAAKNLVCAHLGTQTPAAECKDSNGDALSYYMST